MIEKDQRPVRPLRVSGLAKRYGRRTALEGVTFAIRPGEENERPG
jgi:ABC-type multidrug transport system ATPase subunit